MPPTPAGPRVDGDVDPSSASTCACYSALMRRGLQKGLVGANCWWQWEGQPEECPGPVFSGFVLCVNHPGILLKGRFWLLGLGWGHGFCISKPVPRWCWDSGAQSALSSRAPRSRGWREEVFWHQSLWLVGLTASGKYQNLLWGFMKQVPLLSSQPTPQKPPGFRPGHVYFEKVPERALLTTTCWHPLRGAVLCPGHKDPIQQELPAHWGPPSLSPSCNL